MRTTGTAFASDGHFQGEQDAIDLQTLQDTPHAVRIATDPPHIFYNADTLARHVRANGFVNPRYRAPFDRASVHPILAPAITPEKYAGTVNVMRFLGFPVSDEEVQADVGGGGYAVVPYHIGQPPEVRQELDLIQRRWDELAGPITVDAAFLRALPVAVALRLQYAEAHMHMGDARWFRDALIVRTFEGPSSNSEPVPDHLDPHLYDLAGRFAYAREIQFAHFRNLVLDRYRVLNDFIAFLVLVAPEYIPNPPPLEAIADVMDAILPPFPGGNAYLLNVDDNDDNVATTDQDIDASEEWQLRAPTVLDTNLYRNLLVLTPRTALAPPF